jgi:hypothetical protein
MEMQCWSCITKHGDCKGTNRHLFEGRSRVIFCFIARDCTIRFTKTAKSFFQHDFNEFFVHKNPTWTRTSNAVSTVDKGCAGPSLKNVLYAFFTDSPRKKGIEPYVTHHASSHFP